MTVDVNIEGAADVLSKMEVLSDDIKRKGGRFAMRKAANLVRDAAKRNASRIDDPKSAADISENIAVRFSTRTFRRSGDVMFRVGVMGGAGGRGALSSFGGLPGGDTRHWRHQEFGTKNHAANPFMRRALSENVQAATDEFIKQYNRAIDRALKRAAKQG